MHCDLIVRDARVTTFDDTRPTAHALAVLAGRVIAFDDDALGMTSDRTLDLDGATVLPGFGDAHVHMGWFGLSLDEIDLTTSTSADEVYRAVEERARQLGPDEHVKGSGLNGHDVGALDIEALDRAAGGRPVWLKDHSGHFCTVSTAMLQQIGVLDGVEAPEGGVIVRDSDGRPTGELQEQAQNLVVGLMVPYSHDELVRAIGRATEVFASEGLTHVTEAGIGAGWMGKSAQEVAAYQTARETGALLTRVQLMPTVDALHELNGHAADDMTFGIDLGARTGLGDDHLRLGPVKMWLDGSMRAMTAAVREPFVNGRCGYLQDDPDVMRDRLIRAHAGGWTVAAHAIGDHAIDLALAWFDEAQQRHPRPHVRHRIEHAGLVHDEQIEQMRRLGITPVPQMRFLHAIGDGMAEVLGDDRAELLYRHTSLLDAGIRVPGSSDRPVANGAPLAGIRSMVERTTSRGRVLAAHEAVDVETAIRAYTVDAAWIAGDEHLRGRLRPGSAADLVVLADDPRDVETSQIDSIDVLATYVDGSPTYTCPTGPHPHEEAAP